VTPSQRGTLDSLGLESPRYIRSGESVEREREGSSRSGGEDTLGRLEGSREVLGEWVRQLVVLVTTEEVCL
jgi:hypothetical protein